MKIVNLYQVDAFTDQLFGGNPAGVVTNADELSDTEMAQIAREMNLSETAFVLTPSANTADVKLRFFTPTSEVKFCGHATVGTLFQLALLDLFGLGKPGKNDVHVETDIGILNMAVTNGENASPQITFAAPDVKMTDYRLQGDTFAETFGIPASLLQPGGKILLDKTLNYLYIPVASLKSLSGQTFDSIRIREQFGKEGIVVFCLFTGETVNERSDLHTRGLAPIIGIDEDPFTGSMQAGLVHAAKQNGQIDPTQETIVTEQGYEMGRPGQAVLHHNTATDELLVTAEAVRVFSTRLEL